MEVAGDIFLGVVVVVVDPLNNNDLRDWTRLRTLPLVVLFVSPAPPIPPLDSLVVPSLLIRFILLAEMDIPSPLMAVVVPSLLLLSSSIPSIGSLLELV